MLGRRMLDFVGILTLGLVCCYVVVVSDEVEVETRLNETLIRLSGPDSGGKTRGSDTGFWFGAEKVTWDTAKSFCQQAGLTLLVIQNALKQSRFETYLDATDETGDWSAGGAWLAGTDRHSAACEVGVNRFYWSAVGSEKTEMLYHNFGDPPTLNGCLVVSNANNVAFGKWYVKSCDTYKTVYFCESRF